MAKIASGRRTGEKREQRQRAAAASAGEAGSSCSAEVKLYLRK